MTFFLSLLLQKAPSLALSFLYYFPPSCSLSVVGEWLHNAAYYTFFCLLLIFHPESSPPTLQHISLCARCCWRLNIVSLNHVVTIWCDGCVQTNYSWWYWKPYRKWWDEKNGFCVTQKTFDVLLLSSLAGPAIPSSFAVSTFSCCRSARKAAVSSFNNSITSESTNIRCWIWYDFFAHTSRGDVRTPNTTTHAELPSKNVANMSQSLRQSLLMFKANPAAVQAWVCDF